MKLHRLYLLLLLTSLIIFFSSCKGPEPCIDVQNKVLGNMGSMINTDLDEHSPTILIIPDSIKQQYPNTDTNSYLYFTATRYDMGAQEEIFNLLLNDKDAGTALVDMQDFPLNNREMFRNAGVPVFRVNPEAQRIDLFFAALPINSKKGRLSRDIYYAFKDLNNNEWSEAVQLQINTQYWESHPTISKDGKILLFSSDRPNDNGAAGNIDIWASYLQEDGSWGQPINLGSEINTKSDDYTPMFDEYNNITFSTNGKGQNRNDFDIYSARYDADAKKWVESKMFGFPINTEFNETGACVWNNVISLSSDRRGGCGGTDIYSFHLCGPIIISGKVNCNDANQILEGEILVYDDNENVVTQSVVDANGNFNIDSIPANAHYTINYKNKCYPNKKNIYNMYAPCSDSSVAKVVINMLMPEESMEFVLSKDQVDTNIEIPFFVTGYYMPNTTENLNALKYKFATNTYGIDNKTKYIENPENKYDQYISKVETGLEEVTQYIATMVSVLDNRCIAENEQKARLFIEVQGWADPRNINTISEYIDADINDEELNFNIKKGTKMTNDILSKLRAYFTAKYFQAKLINDFEFNELMKYVKWDIKGMGVDNAENMDNELKRKVHISLMLDTEK